MIIIKFIQILILPWSILSRVILQEPLHVLVIGYDPKVGEVFLSGNIAFEVRKQTKKEIQLLKHERKEKR